MDFGKKLRKPIAIIAPDFKSEALTSLVVNHMKSVLKVVAIKTPILTAPRFCINSNEIHLSFMRDSFQDELFSFVIEFKFLLQRVVSTHCLSCFFAFFNLVPIRRSCLHLALAFYTRVCLPNTHCTTHILSNHQGTVR